MAELLVKKFENPAALRNRDVYISYTTHDLCVVLGPPGTIVLFISFLERNWFVEADHHGIIWWRRY